MDTQNLTVVEVLFPGGSEKDMCINEISWQSDSVERTEFAHYLT